MSRKQPETNGRKLQYTRAQPFRAAVVSTMSSGKSTIINAMIGTELLPAKNQACTAAATAVLDNDLARDITGHVLYRDGRYEELRNCGATQIAECLRRMGDTVEDITVECSIPGIRNLNRALMLVDTPGVNNHADVTHAAITKAYLQESMSDGLILYVLNATQLGTQDDRVLLDTVREILETKPRLELLFALNKGDELDPEREPLEKVLQDTHAYLRDAGFREISIYPVSALAALLLRRAMSGEQMTVKEQGDFLRLYGQFASTDLRLSTYALLDGVRDPEEHCTVGRRSYHRRELLAALENTGMPALERAMEDRMVRQMRIEHPGVRKPGRLRAPKPSLLKPPAAEARAKIPGKLPRKSEKNDERMV